MIPSMLSLDHVGFLPLIWRQGIGPRNKAQDSIYHTARSVRMESHGFRSLQHPWYIQETDGTGFARFALENLSHLLG